MLFSFCTAYEALRADRAAIGTVYDEYSLDPTKHELSIPRLSTG